VRQFKFRLDGVLVTAETAQNFMVLHEQRNEHPIIGAYADSETNALVVVGPPECEQEVRTTLATWTVATQGFSPAPLKVQMRRLVFQRTELLREMAALEIGMVAAEGEQAAKMRERLASFEGELTVVEKQIEVVDRYAERMKQLESRDSQLLTADPQAGEPTKVVSAAVPE
jgi:hypothetical protein